MENKPILKGQKQGGPWRPDCSGSECWHGLILVGQGRRPWEPGPGPNQKARGKRATAESRKAPQKSPNLYQFLTPSIF
jgi:hypothetical protein